MELAIDTVGMTSSVAVSDQGTPVAEITWPSGRRHTPTLIPMIDAVIRAAAIERADLTAVAVDTGPGAYGGIRAGMATTGALAVVMGIPAIGVGRLEIEAYPHAAAARGGTIAAVHRAGRGQWALALYRGLGDNWREDLPPSLCTRSELVDKLCALSAGGLLCGEADHSRPKRVKLSPKRCFKGEIFEQRRGERLLPFLVQGVDQCVFVFEVTIDRSRTDAGALGHRRH